ncbi:exosortase-associated EpsI family protein [Gemmata sp. G18]|uniref:Exosortase-associated EpsI family protein n=1 Tax=Gemmata palustris TaxID=2822762 RepID=A0ABS5C4D0_9BACT|nr:exosortase-associated EpsI family protein [Gemmata palustris]MBP3960690.1 exosortase-associated EpsI family protein [Gemmata palustris]
MSALVISVTGAVYGVQTDRWRPSGELQNALARLERVPPVCGDWRGEDISYEAGDMARAGIKGCVYRSYRNARTRETVSILLVCGRGGPISVHTPDVCYAGAGYKQLTDTPTKDVEWGESQKGTFRVARFGKAGVVPTQLEIYWGWSRDGHVWDAPTNPRLSLARLPAVYKIYVVRQFVAGTRDESAESCRDFLRQALPDVTRALAASD